MPTTEATDPRRLARCSGRLLGKMRRTSRRWNTLPEGERVVLAVSGGIDSLAMTYLVDRFSRRLRTALDLVAVHVRLDADGSTGDLPQRIRSWLWQLGLEVAEVDARLDGSEKPPLDCYACARARRRTLLEVAEGFGAGRVALAHHADDVVETWLLSLAYTGTAESMPPVRSYFDGSITVVRPLYELQRGELVRLASAAGLPKPTARCRREDETRRAKVRAAISAFGRDQNLVRRQLFWAAVRRYDELEA